MNSAVKNQALVDALVKNLPNDASEAQVSQIFASELFNFLNFEINECVPSFSTGNGTEAVDHALRHHTENDIFAQTKTNPYILVELKARNVNLTPGSTQYKKTVAQIKRYLLAENCKAAKWGIITNGNHIQLLRRHGKVIHPATVCLELTPENIIKIATSIKEKIYRPKKALTVAVYNNKGGVGKTTTTVNTAATLSLYNQKVLIVDFDPNQRDLTNSLEIKPGTATLHGCLVNKNINVTDVISTYNINNKKNKKEIGFDVIPVYGNSEDWDEDTLRQNISVNWTFGKKCVKVVQNHYIAIFLPKNTKCDERNNPIRLTSML